MAFEANEFVDLLDRPELTVARSSWWERALVKLRVLGRTRTYTGRLLSHAEWVPFAERLLAASAGELDVEEADAVYTAYLDTIGIPPRVVFALPPGVMVAALADFFVCQKSALRLPEGFEGVIKDQLRPETDFPNGGKTTKPKTTSTESRLASK